MNNLGDYPLGAANDSRAPYNEIENPEIELDLYVYYSIGKTIKVKTKDYKIQKWMDDTGHHSEINFDDTDFSSIIEENCPPPEGWKELDCDFILEKWH